MKIAFLVMKSENYFSIKVKNDDKVNRVGRKDFFFVI